MEAVERLLSTSVNINSRTEDVRLSTSECVVSFLTRFIDCCSTGLCIRTTCRKDTLLYCYPLSEVMLRLYVCCSRLGLQSSFLTRFGVHVMFYCVMLPVPIVCTCTVSQDSTVLGFILWSQSSSGAAAREWS